MKALLLVAALGGMARAEDVELTWAVGADRPNPKDPDGLPLRPVDLEVKLGGATRRISLKPQTGGLSPMNQVMCQTSAYPLTKGQLAKITFYEGGASGYSVSRPAPTVLRISRWSVTDGACEDPKTHDLTACPVDESAVSTVDIPASAKLVGGAIATMDHGKRVRFSCN
jgi:hypothetical protein